MIRQFLLSVLASFLVVSLAAAADDPAPDQPEPPVRLKKKAKPKPAPAAEEKKPQPPQEKKDDDKRGTETKDPEPATADPEQEEKEILDRVAKNMRDSEDRLAKKDAGDGTQHVQRDIVKDLESLIKQSQQPPQSSQQNPQANQDPQRQSRGADSKKDRRTQMRRRPSPGKTTTARGDQKSNPGQQPQPANSNQGGMGQKSQGPINKLADLYKDVWGHLPEMLRLEMDAYSREQFMAKYNELLKQYYATIAEKGRRKGD